MTSVVFGFALFSSLLLLGVLHFSQAFLGFGVFLGLGILAVCFVYFGF